MASFSLRLAAHAVLNPVVFRDPEDLAAMAEALRGAALAALRMGNQATHDRYQARADYLLTLA